MRGKPAMSGLALRAGEAGTTVQDPRLDQETRAECIEVATRFFHFLDRSEFDRLASLFVADGCWVRQGVPLTGPGEIRRAMEGRAKDVTTRHLISNIIVDPAEPATVHLSYDVSVFSKTKEAPPRHVQILSGRDKLVLVDGRWKIAHKEAGPVLKFVPPKRRPASRSS